MATHYEAIQRYPADHGWESKPTGDVQDMEADKTLEIRTYLNSLLTLNATARSPSNNALPGLMGAVTGATPRFCIGCMGIVTKGRTSRNRKRVFFELEMEDAPPLGVAAPVEAPTPPKPTINVVTSRRTFPADVPNANTTVTVPWPPPSSNTENALVEWYGTLPLLHHDLNQVLLTHRHPLHAWVHRPPDPSPAAQAWFTTNIYPVIDLAA